MCTFGPQFSLPEAQPRGAGWRSYFGVCANRGRTIHRSTKHTILIQDPDVETPKRIRVGKCQCGLLVFLTRKPKRPWLTANQEDDYKGADHV
jgi:hypothetical protein